MITFIKQKLLYKKWLNVCLLVGIVMLVAVAACLPMYQSMSENQAFQNRMKEYIQDCGKYPAIVTLFRGATYKKSAGAYDNTVDAMVQLDDPLQQDLKLTYQEKETIYTLKESGIVPVINAAKRKGGKTLRISYLTGLEEHWKLLATEQAGEGKVAGYVSAAMLENAHLYLGQTIEMKDYVDAHGNPLQMVIAGVFEEKDTEDAYWAKAPAEYIENVFVTEDDLRSIVEAQPEKVTIRCYSYYFYDYTKMKAKHIADYYKVLKRYDKAGFGDNKVDVTSDMTELLDETLKQAKKIRAILWVLELPILALILVFIYMISAQILELEGNEIATLKSRGVSLRQIVWIYFCQASILSGIGVVLGIPVGYAVCRLIGQSNAFLEFVNRRHLMAAVTGKSILFAFGSAMLAIAFMTLPLLKSARVDIVAKKSGRGKSDISFFERYYIDVVLLVVSGYAYYSFQGQRADIAQRVLNGDGLDPVLFLSAVLFMAGAGMVILRILRFVANGIYRLGEKHWSPAVYASFLQIMRTRGRQTFIALFLVVSIAMGIFYSNIARTINQNEEERICYNLGADLVVKEQWQTMSRTYRIGDKQMTDLFYVEPATNLYEKLRKVTDSAAEVVRHDINIKSAKDLTQYGELMAIQTEDFGNTAWMRDGLLDKHWYYYLNDLAEKADNVLVSSNARDAFNLKVGDTITYTPQEQDGKYQETLGGVSGTICGFVDAWPGFTGYKTITDEEGNQKQETTYLVVANYSYVESCCGIQPAEIWMKTGGNNDAALQTIQDSGAVVEYQEDMYQRLALAKQGAMIQITNGMLTLSFLVVMILCMIGFLIYWITSIRQRELLFGIYRAMGMSMKEMIQMLVNEQVFCSLLAIAAGVCGGIATSKLFISLITIAYAPENHVLPYALYTSGTDMVRIGVVVVIMLGGAIGILARMLGHMKIAQAIKMGED